MPRQVLDESRIHPAVRDKVANLHADIIHNVAAAASSNAVLVVGMRGNPFCRKVRKLLEGGGIAHHYLEYGSYLSEWRRRNALKMWAGWPTFPMVFVRGALVGGYDDTAKLVASGELKRLLGE